MSLADPTSSFDCPPPASWPRYDGHVPRYTSYPTAVEFTNAVDEATGGGWLGEVCSRGAAVGLRPHPLLQAAVLVLRLQHPGGEPQPQPDQ